MIEWKQELLSKHTTFRIGGPADYYMVPESKEEVIQAIHFATDDMGSDKAMFSALLNILIIIIINIIFIHTLSPFLHLLIYRVTPFIAFWQW